MNELTEQARPAAEAPSTGSGEWGAFERLYRESRDDLYAYLAFLLADRARAEDVLAQAFERAYRKRAKFDARRGELRAWLFGIARNLALDELRRGKHELALDGAALDLPAAGDAGETALDRVLIATAVRGLEPRDREIVALKFFAGLGNREIARVVGRSETNVGSQLHRAVRKLREVLDA